MATSMRMTVDKIIHNPGSDQTEIFRFSAFISYSHSDGARARWLHGASRDLSGAGVLAQPAGRESEDRAVGPVFRDREELPGAASLSQVIIGALTDSRFLIVVCSPSGPLGVRQLGGGLFSLPGAIRPRSGGHRRWRTQCDS